MMFAMVVMLALQLTSAAGGGAQAVVRALEARYHRAGTLEAVFLERFCDGHSGIQVESGRVYFSKPGRMRWEYESPETKLFLVDGTNVWFYVPADRTASRARIRESSDWRTPLALLVGKARLSQFCGRIDLLDSEKETGAGYRPSDAGNMVLRCLPRDESSHKPRSSTSPGAENSGMSPREPFREVLLEVDPEYRLVRVRVREPGNIETEFRFANWQENLPLPEAQFHFKPPPGVAIVDQDALFDALH